MSKSKIKLNENENAKISAGYSIYSKDNLGMFKSDDREYKSRNIYCDFCFKLLQGKGIFSFEGKDVCLNCYKKLCDLDFQKRNLETKPLDFNNTKTQITKK